MSAVPRARRAWSYESYAMVWSAMPSTMACRSLRLSDIADFQSCLAQVLCDPVEGVRRPRLRVELAGDLPQRDRRVGGRVAVVERHPVADHVVRVQAAAAAVRGV